MNYFAAINSYSSESSVGFANTWSVLVFNSKTKRDEYVSQADDMATRAITKKQIKDYVEAPKSFSGLRRAIDTRAPCPDLSFGVVSLMYPGEGVDL